MKQKRIALFALGVGACGFVGYFPTRLWIARHQQPRPQAIVVLGGTPDREQIAARLGQTRPNLEIWVSSGTPEAAEIFDRQGIVRSRLHLDTRATDTVTNFTTLVEDLKQRRVQHVYLVTSDFHMSRATAIGSVVFGSRGIAFTPVATHNPFYPPESRLRLIRDVGRSLMWVVTGQTGSPDHENSR